MKIKVFDPEDGFVELDGFRIPLHPKYKFAFVYGKMQGEYYITEMTSGLRLTQIHVSRNAAILDGMAGLEKHNKKLATQIKAGIKKTGGTGWDKKTQTYK